MKPVVLRSIFALVAIACLNTVGVAKSQDTQKSDNAYTQTVTREVLASGEPDSALGYILELVRYVIPPNVSLPLHTHPGMQIEKVESGTLTYKVVKGEAKVIRADKSVEIIKAGQETRLKQGDSLVEPAYMEHYGKNETSEPIILLSASLFEKDKPKAILVP